MSWILVLILLNNHAFHDSLEVERFTSMEDCFEARQALVKKIGRPIVNYQAICVQYDKELLFEQGKPKFNK